MYLEATNSNNQTYTISNAVVNVGGSITLSGSGVPNRTNVVQRATTLTPPIPWTPIGTNQIDGTGHWQFTDPSPINPSFYRSVTQP
ncbi:MAG TPA: hypothetical protein VNM37_09985 [Candidatus Dormibacteraeota bacterium]|nr:hypothetical protein [Candidatus Dormibacteraeota bacterium]